MDYQDALSTLTISSKTTKLLGVGVAATAFLLVTIPVLNSGVLYADSGDNDGDQGEHDNNCDHGDHDNHNHNSDNE
jgi:hypothetical protein